MTVTYKILDTISATGYGLDDRIASCYEDSIEFTAKNDAEAYRTAERLQREHDAEARKAIEDAPEEDKYDLEESYNNAPCYTAQLWRCDDDDDVKIESDPSFKLNAWIRICSDPRVGESVAVNDDDQLRAQMRECGWTEEDWQSFINDENERPAIVDARFVELIANDEAVYKTDDGEFFRVWDNGEVSYLKDGWEEE